MPKFSSLDPVARIKPIVLWDWDGTIVLSSMDPLPSRCEFLLEHVKQNLLNPELLIPLFQKLHEAGVEQFVVSYRHKNIQESPSKSCSSSESIIRVLDVLFGKDREFLQPDKIFAFMPLEEPDTDTETERSFLDEDDFDRSVGKERHIIEVLTKYYGYADRSEKEKRALLKKCLLIDNNKHNIRVAKSHLLFDEPKDKLPGETVVYYAFWVRRRWEIAHLNPYHIFLTVMLSLAEYLCSIDKEYFPEDLWSMVFRSGIAGYARASGLSFTPMMLKIGLFCSCEVTASSLGNVDIDRLTGNPLLEDDRRRAFWETREIAQQVKADAAGTPFLLG